MPAPREREDEQHYEVIPIDSVIPFPGNARRGDVAAIKRSIEGLGFRGAIVVQKSSRRIVVGNHRWLAAKELGHAEIPALIADIDDARAHALVLADNHSSDLGTYDRDDLAAFITKVTELDLLEITSYSPLDVDTILGNKPEPTVEAIQSDQAGSGYVWASLGRLQVRVKGPAYKRRVQELIAEHDGDETAAALHVSRLLGFVTDDLILGDRDA